MAALQYVDMSEYRALIVRRKFTDLVKADALIPRSFEWLAGSGAGWNEQKHRWTFPSGATLEFGHCEHENSKYDYQGAAWHFIGFDELTQFSETQYTYIGISRLRRRADSSIPVRTRGTANPGGIGHDWVRARFVDPKTRRAPFIPARLEDNPSLNREEYREGLMELDAVTREQLLSGNWDVRPRGPLFDRTWFEIVDAPPSGAKRVRFWDLAATEAKAGTDPDWTVGALVSEKDGLYWVEDVRRVRKRPKDVEQLVWQTALIDTNRTPIGMEHEGGSSGVAVVEHYGRHVLKGCSFKGYRPTGSKVERAQIWSSASERGMVKLVRGAWNKEFLDEVEAFPFTGHDDQVDAVSGAFLMLTEPRIVLR